MVYDKTQRIDEFLAATSAKQPTPGGGSVAALAGALAAAIGEMVLNYSVGKKDLAQHEPQLKLALTELTRARALMLELMLEDQAGYEALTAIRKMPLTDPNRAAKLEAALAVCITIPQTIGATAVAILDISSRMVDHVNKYLLSDLAVCAELAMATLRCASYNVRINLTDVNSSERYQLESAVLKQVVGGSKLMQDLIPRIWARVGKGLMPSDPRDYKVEIDGVSQPTERKTNQGKPYLSIHFRCCGVYCRIYRSRDGSAYAGNCPRRGQPVRFLIGEGGTDERFFIVE